MGFMRPATCEGKQSATESHLHSSPEVFGWVDIIRRALFVRVIDTHLRILVGVCTLAVQLLEKLHHLCVICHVDSPLIGCAAAGGDALIASRNAM